MFALVGFAGVAMTAGLLTTAPAASSAGFVLEWSAPVSVSTPGNTAGDALVTASADGSRQAVSWVQIESSRTRAYVAVSDDSGATWDDSTALSVGGQNAAYLDLAMSADGMNLVAGWRRYNGSNWLAQATGSSDGGLTWSAPSTLSTAGANIFLPDAAIAAQSARRVMVWQRDQNPDVIQATVSDDSTTWGSTGDISTGSGNAVVSKIAISDDGQHLVAVWSKVVSGFQIQARVSADGGASWGPAMTFPTVGGASGARVAMSGDGVRVVTTWVDFDGTSNRIAVRTSDDSAATWNAIGTLSDAGKNAGSPTLATSADGSVSTVAWKVSDAGVEYAQVAVTTDAGVTWSSPITVSAGSPAVVEPRVSISADGTRQAVVWSDLVGSNYVNRLSYSLDSGATWSEPFDLSDAGAAPAYPSVAVAGDGSGMVVGYPAAGSATAIEVRSAHFIAAPVPVTVPSPVPAAAPMDVAVVAGDSSAEVSWGSPASSGSFPVSTYQVRTTPGSAGCLVPASSTACMIGALSNGSEYEVQVRALTGAGWGPWSGSVSVVPTPPDTVRSMVITGSRDGRQVRVAGVTAGMVGEQVTPWVRLPGQSGYTPEASVRTVDAQGEFTWQRQTSKKVYGYFRASDDVRSNRVIIPPR